MKLFLDTNVLVDHALKRSTGQPFETKFLISWALENQIPLFVSPGSLYTFTYVLQKEGVRGVQLRATLGLYLQILTVSSIDKKCFSDALESSNRDLEDSFQYQAALAENCDFLITNNIKDFKDLSAKVVVLSAKTFVNNVLAKKKGVDY